MSYPPVTYTGDGAALARFRRADDPADLPTATGAAHYLATGATTAGRYGLYRWDMGPEPSGPGPHFHRTMSEAFFVLSGVVSLYDGTAWTDAGPGDFCFVPEGGVHGFRNESGADASMLILFAPGGPREEYFEGLVDWVTGRWDPTHEELEEFYVRHDNHWVAQD